jgi:hypothetical protein
MGESSEAKEGQCKQVQKENGRYNTMKRGNRKDIGNGGERNLILLQLKKSLFRLITLDPYNIGAHCNAIRGHNS